MAELRVVILKARRLADDDAERERAAAAVKTWLLDQIDKKRAPRRTSRSPPNASPLSGRPSHKAAVIDVALIEPIAL